MSTINTNISSNLLQEAMIIDAENALDALSRRNHNIISDEEYIRRLRIIVNSVRRKCADKTALMKARKKYHEAFNTYMQSRMLYEGSVAVESVIVDLVKAENAYILEFVEYGKVAYGIYLDYEKIICDSKQRDIALNRCEEL